MTAGQTTKIVPRTVVFLGFCAQQLRWGSYTGDHSKLKVGADYTLVSEDVHSWHTKVYLEGRDGSFNSVCFRESDDSVKKGDE